MWQWLWPQLYWWSPSAHWPPPPRSDFYICSFCGCRPPRGRAEWIEPSVRLQPRRGDPSSGRGGSWGHTRLVPFPRDRCALSPLLSLSLVGGGLHQRSDLWPWFGPSSGLCGQHLPVHIKMGGVYVSWLDYCWQGQHCIWPSVRLKVTDHLPVSVQALSPRIAIAEVLQNIAICVTFETEFLEFLECQNQTCQSRYAFFVFVFVSPIFFIIFYFKKMTFSLCKIVYNVYPNSKTVWILYGLCMACESYSICLKWQSSVWKVMCERTCYLLSHDGIMKPSVWFFPSPYWWHSESHPVWKDGVTWPKYF